MKNVIFIALAFIFVGHTASADEKLSIPSDPTGHYEVLSLEKIGSSERELATKRTGSSGVSYSKIRIDCKTRTFQGLGEGESFAEMNEPNITKKGLTVVEGSIKFYQVNYACSK